MNPPEGLAKWFTLDAITAGEIGIDLITSDLLSEPQLSLSHDTLITPFIRVLPMGFSWSLHFCQLALTNALSMPLVKTGSSFGQFRTVLLPHV